MTIAVAVQTAPAAEADPAGIDEQELQALSRMLYRSDGRFALVLVRCDQFPRRHALIFNLKAKLHPLGLWPAEFVVTGDADTLRLPELLANCGGGIGRPVFVYGLETILPEADPLPALRVLNQRREAFGAITAPVVFWVPDYVLQLIARHAPDFWAWRSGAFFFRPDPSLETGVDDRWVEKPHEWLASLSIREKERQVKLLELLLLDYVGDRPPVLRARAQALNTLAILRFMLGDNRGGAEASGEQLSLGEGLGDPAVQAAALGNLGFALLDKGQVSESIPKLEAALTLWREANEPEHAAETLTHIGNAHSECDNYDFAERTLREAVDCARSTGDRAVEASALGSLAGFLAKTGRGEDAVPLLLEAIETARQAGDRSAKAVRLGNLAYVYLSLSRADEAEQISRQALAIAREIGERRVEANALGNLGLARQMSGDYGGALGFYQAAFSTALGNGNEREQASLLGNMGNVRLANGDAPSATGDYRRALEIARRLGLAPLEHRLLHNLAMAFDTQGAARAAAAARLLESRTGARKPAGGPPTRGTEVLAASGDRDEDPLVEAEDVLQEAIESVAGLRR